MRLNEKWYSITPIKGYVIKQDFIKIKINLEMKLNYNVNFIKKRDFILVIVTSKKPILISRKSIYDILKYDTYKKAYSIGYIGTERKMILLDKRLTIGIPY